MSSLTVGQAIEKLSELDPNMELCQVDSDKSAMYFNTEGVETMNVQDGKGGIKTVARIVVHRDSVVLKPKYPKEWHRY